MILLLVTVSALIGGIHTLTREDAQEYMAKVLEQRFPDEATYNRLDPYSIKDLAITANKTGGESVAVTFSKGAIVGLAHPVCRNCSQPLWTGPNITFACSLGFDDLHVAFAVGIGEQSILQDRRVRGANFRVQVTSNSELNLPTLRSFHVNRVGNFTADDDGEAIQDERLRKTVQRTMQSLAFSNIRAALSGRFRYALAYSIYRTPMDMISY